MFKFLKNLFQRKPRTISVECDDPFEAAVVLQAFKTGNIVFSSRNKDGLMTITEVPRDK